MITIEERNLFGKWEAVAGQTFETVEAARAWCVVRADVLNIAYRILQDGQVIKVIDFEAEFFELGRDKPPSDPT